MYILPYVNIRIMILSTYIYVYVLSYVYIENHHHIFMSYIDIHVIQIYI